jgi:hypothetical protein
MKFWVKVGKTASVVMLLGVFLPAMHHNSGIEFYVEDISKDPFPSLIILLAIVSFFAAKKEKRITLWVTATISTLLILLQLYFELDFLGQTSHLNEILILLPGGYTASHLGIGWVFLITGSLTVLLSAVFSVEAWGLGPRAEATLEAITEKTTDAIKEKVNSIRTTRHDFTSNEPTESTENAGPDIQIENRIPCPMCAEMIMPNALACRFCGAELEK